MLSQGNRCPATQRANLQRRLGCRDTAAHSCNVVLLRWCAHNRSGMWRFLELGLGPGAGNAVDRLVSWVPYLCQILSGMCFVWILHSLQFSTIRVGGLSRPNTALVVCCSPAWAPHTFACVCSSLVVNTEKRLLSSSGSNPDTSSLARAIMADTWVQRMASSTRVVMRAHTTQKLGKALSSAQNVQAIDPSVVLGF